ncbi:MAG: dihydrofolate reductase, partial [Gammaproteobacteria bacterium]|nr:dihydrofolate reductase [Gammaproteobacteria bacterium]
GTLIMGRKTFDSIGRPLPGRTTIIVTRKNGYVADNCIVSHSVAEAVQTAEKLGKTVFIAGGGEIYRQTIDQVDEIHLTAIDTQAEGDVHFPDFDKDRFDLVRTQAFESNINYVYRHYKRIA